MHLISRSTRIGRAGAAESPVGGGNSSNVRAAGLLGLGVRDGVIGCAWARPPCGVSPLTLPGPGRHVARPGASGWVA